MRILHLIAYLTGGGAERQMLHLSREQSQAGHEVHVGFMYGGPDASTVDWGHARLHTVRERPTANPLMWWQILQLVRRTRPDIVHTWVQRMDIVGGGVSTLLRVPWLMREASSAECYPPSSRVRLRARAARHSRMIVSNSPGGDRYWGDLYPEKPRRVIPNGLPVSAIDGASTDGVPGILPRGCEPLAVFTGRLEPEKNLDRLIDALAEVMSSRPLTAVLCGEGTLRASLEDRVVRHGLEERILLPGHLPGPQVWALMKRADVFTFVSLFEGLPNVVMEAMVCGAPLVVSDIPAHRDFLDESCAVFVPADDPSAIARGIVEVLQMPREESQKARVGQERARRWSIPEMARRYEAAYKEAIGTVGR